MAPVGLVSAAAILFSAITAKYSHLADQVRLLAAEHRQANTTSLRKQSITVQITLFKSRINILWAANGCLALALVLFTATILIVIVSQRITRLGAAAIGTLIVGSSYFLVALVLECVEIWLARRTLAAEMVLEDVPVSGGPPAGS